MLTPLPDKISLQRLCDTRSTSLLRTSFQDVISKEITHLPDQSKFSAETSFHHWGSASKWISLTLVLCFRWGLIRPPLFNLNPRTNASSTRRHIRIFLFFFSIYHHGRHHPFSLDLSEAQAKHRHDILESGWAVNSTSRPLPVLADTRRFPFGSNERFGAHPWLHGRESQLLYYPESGPLCNCIAQFASFDSFL